MVPLGDLEIPPRESVDLRGLCLTEGTLGATRSSSEVEFARDRACECKDTFEGCERRAFCRRSDDVDLTDWILVATSGIGGGSPPYGIWGDGRGSAEGIGKFEVGWGDILGDSRGETG